VNWKLISIYTPIFFIFSVASAIPLGYAQAKYDTLEQNMPILLQVSLDFLSFVVPTIVLIFLSRHQLNKPYVHSIVVVCLSSLVSCFGVWLLIDQIYYGNWVLDYILLVMTLVSGTFIGTRMKPKVAV
jgi:hypothetical protein